jgi:hypothetical protein
VKQVLLTGIQIAQYPLEAAEAKLPVVELDVLEGEINDRRLPLQLPHVFMLPCGKLLKQFAVVRFRFSKKYLSMVMLRVFPKRRGRGSRMTSLPSSMISFINRLLST